MFNGSVFMIDMNSDKDPFYRSKKKRLIQCIEVQPLFNNLEGNIIVSFYYCSY